MLPTTLRGEDVFLVPFLANWSEKLSLTLSVESAITRSLEGMEAREAKGQTLRAQMECSLFLRAAESELFRAALRNLADKRVLMPLWPMARRLAGGDALYTDHTGAIYTTSDGIPFTTGTPQFIPPPILTGIWLTWGMRNADFGMPNEIPAGCSCVLTADSFYIIHESPASPPSFRIPGASFRVPLMLGYLDDIVEPVALNARLLSAKLKFVDSAPAIFAPRVDPAPVFSTAPDGRPVFPFNPNWSNPVNVAASYEIKREQIGDGREPATTYFPQIAARTMQATFTTFSWDDLARLVAFFHARQGVVGSFHARHALEGDILARFAKPSVTFEFASGRIADAKIGIIELPREANPPDGEIVGVTLGEMPPTAQLFRFIRRYPGGMVIDRFTGYERAVNAGGEIFLNKKIEHGDIVDSLEADKTKVTLKADAFDGNPLMLFSPPKLEVPLEIEILEANPDADGNAPAPQLLFSGFVSKPKVKGIVLTAEAKHWMADLLRDVPDDLVQAECNHELYSPPCGVLQDDWTFLATVSRYDDHTLTLGNLTRKNGAALPAFAAGWLARGRLWCGAGAAFQTRAINNSTAIINGEITLTMAQPFDRAPAGEIAFIPACDGSPDWCRFFQGGIRRHGGFPFVPPGNPSLKAIKNEPSQGKK